MQFCSNDVECINKRVNIPVPLPFQEADLFSKFEIRKCIDWILLGKYGKVCLQFPDELLDNVVGVVEYIENEINNKVYVLADTSYRSCCIHDITAKHVDADAIIHFGRACLSRFYDLPVLYVFPKAFIDVVDVVSQITDLLKVNANRFIVLLYDVVFNYCIDEIEKAIEDGHDKVIYSRLTCDEMKICCVNCKITDKNISRHSITKFGRTYCSPANDAVIEYLYLTAPGYRKNLDNFITYFSESTIYSYNSDLRTLTKQSLPGNVKRRLYQIERVKDANIIGILIAMSPNDEILTLVNRIKMLCRRKSKKCYTMYVGNPNVAKLANFPEVDVFVFISCLEGELTEGDYYQPVVTMMELELGLNECQKWKNRIVTDFREFLAGGEEYIDLNTITLTDIIPDMSLISNRLRSSINTESDEITSSRDETTLLVKDPMPLVSALDAAKGGLAARTWKGLEMNAGDVPVIKAVIGHAGTPSTGYTCAQSDTLK